MVPRNSAQPISPSATWAGRIGVARTASYSLSYLSRKKMLNVESYIAPFIEDTASKPGVPVDPDVPFEQAQAAHVAVLGSSPPQPLQPPGRRQHPQRQARHALPA